MGKAHKFLIFSLLFFTSISINYCYDGDTCTSDKGEKIRLACIDAPELKGPEANPKKAKAARNHLRDLVYKKIYKFVESQKIIMEELWENYLLMD